MEWHICLHQPRFIILWTGGNDLDKPTAHNDPVKRTDLLHGNPGYVLERQFSFVSHLLIKADVTIVHKFYFAWYLQQLSNSV